MIDIPISSEKLNNNRIGNTINFQQLIVNTLTTWKNKKQ